MSSIQISDANLMVRELLGGSVERARMKGMASVARDSALLAHDGVLYVHDYTKPAVYAKS